MTVLDAYAVVAYLRKEAAAEEVTKLLRSPCLLSTANATEVVDQMVRVFGRDPDEVHTDLALLCHAGMTMEWLSPDVAVTAGRLRAKHYHRSRRSVSLADCIAAATALATRRPLATADPALVAVVRAEGGDVYGLPDSSGRRP